MQTINKRPLILASSSQYRLARMQEAGLVINTHSADINEEPLEGESARTLSKRLATQKAQKVALHYNSGLVIGCDQVAHLAHGSTDVILGKPGSLSAACKQLRMCSNQAVIFYTAISVIDCETKKIESQVEEVEVKFASLTDKQINKYLAVDNPIYCAGSFMMERAGIFLFNSIHTIDPNSLLGIPLIALKHLLLAHQADIFDYLVISKDIK